MRIRSLDPLPPLQESATVLVNVESFDVDLAAFESGSVFLRTPREELLQDRPVVVVNPTPSSLRPVAGLIEAGRIRGAHLWADPTAIAALSACTQEFDNLAIAHASQIDEWVRLYVVPEIAGDRSAAALSFGLGAAQRAQENLDPIHSVTPSLGKDVATAKAELVRVAAKLMKPIKPYLPPQIVHLLYQILGVLR